MLAFINMQVPHPLLAVACVVIACAALTIAWVRSAPSKGMSPSTINYRGVRLRAHPSVPAGKIVVLNPQGYTLTGMTMQMLDALAQAPGHAVLLSRKDFEMLFTKVRGLAWRATARDIINY